MPDNGTVKVCSGHILVHGYSRHVLLTRLCRACLQAFMLLSVPRQCLQESRG